MSAKEFIPSIFLSILYLTSCSDTDEQILVSSKLVVTETKPAVEVSGMTSLGSDYVSLENMAVVDSLMITSTLKSDKKLMVTVLPSTDTSLLRFCPLGRSQMEPLTIMPRIDCFKESGGGISALLLSYSDGKLFNWNISASISSGNTVYDGAVKLEKQDNGILPLMSLYGLPEDKLIAFNTRQYSSEIQPEYEVRSRTSGKIISSIKPFACLDKKIREKYPLIEPQYCMDAVNESRNTLVSVMWCGPIVNIVDLKTEQFVSYRIKGLPGMDLERDYIHFIDVSADDNRIYALYAGCCSKDYSGSRTSLYVMDWKGKVLKVFDLGKTFDQVVCDEERLYLSMSTGDELFVFPKSSLTL